MSQPAESGATRGGRGNQRGRGRGGNGGGDRGKPYPKAAGAAAGNQPNENKAAETVNAKLLHTDHAELQKINTILQQVFVVGDERATSANIDAKELAYKVMKGDVGARHAYAVTGKPPTPLPKLHHIGKMYATTDVARAAADSKTFWETSYGGRLAGAIEPPEAGAALIGTNTTDTSKMSFLWEVKRGGTKVGENGMGITKFCGFGAVHHIFAVVKIDNGKESTCNYFRQTEESFLSVCNGFLGGAWANAWVVVHTLADAETLEDLQSLPPPGQRLVPGKAKFTRSLMAGLAWWAAAIAKKFPNDVVQDAPVRHQDAATVKVADLFG
jgi:hypothetical protein